MNGRTRVFLAVVAMVVTGGGLWLTNQAVAPREVTSADVLNEAKHGGYRLISTEELWERYQKTRENLLLVDTRQEWEYRTGHIQGAVNFPMEPTWWSRWRKKSDLESLLGQNKDLAIVFY